MRIISKRKFIAAVAGIILFGVPTSLRADPLTSDAAEVAYRDWSFCAICRLSNTESDNLLVPYKLYKLDPIKIYWGSRKDVSEKLFTPLSRNQKDVSLKTHQYLILIRNPNGLAPGEAYNCKITIWDESTPAKQYLLKGESGITGDELRQALEKICDTMRKRFPIDETTETDVEDKK